MTDLREAAQQALEYIISTNKPSQFWLVPESNLNKTVTALRAALAEPQTAPAPGYCKHCKQYTIEEPLPAEPVQEPVAWAKYDLDQMVEAFSRVIEAHHSSHHPFHNPIDMDARTALRILRGFIPAMKAYAAPPQRKPLDDLAIADIYTKWDATPGVSMADFARAIEAVHGIIESEIQGDKA